MKTSQEIKSEIEKKITKLNKLCSNLVFSFKDGDFSCSVENHLNINGKEGGSFGVFSIIVLLEKGKTRQQAYEECNAFLDGMIAGTRLLDSKSYHNTIASKQ